MEKLQKIADNLTCEVMERIFGEKFTSCEDITEDDEMNKEWEIINEKIFSSLEMAVGFNKKEKTYVLSFAVADYEKTTLDELSEQELYEIAGKNDVYTLKEFQLLLNSDMISIDDKWIYFVTI